MKHARAPAFRSASLLICGVLGASAFPPHSLPLWTVAIGLLFALTVTSLLRHSPLAASILAAMLYVVLGIGMYRAAAEGGPVLPAELEGERATVEALLQEDPRLAGRSIRFLAQVLRAESGNRISAVHGVALVRWSPASGDTAPPRLEEGDRALISGRLYPTGGPRNPGEFDRGGWLRANGIDFEVAARGVRSVVRVTSSRELAPLRGVVRALRRGILAGIDRHVGGEEGAFLKGLLIGERSGIDPETTEAFARAGVAHVLAVSGSNVAVVFLFLGFLLSPFRRFPLFRSLFLCAGAVLYMLITGAQPPVARATLMAGIGLAAVLFQERVNGLNLLGLAALLLAAADPRAVFDVGFQLSFLAVLSLIVGTPPMNSLLRPLAEKRGPGRALRALLAVALVSLAATIGTLPLTAGAFGRVSVIGIFANVVVVPATGISVLLGSITAILDPLWGWGASVYGAANWGVLRLTLWFTRWAAHPSFASLSTDWFTAAHGALFCAFLLAAASIGSRTFRIAAPLFLALLALLPWLPMDRIVHPVPGRTRVTVLDVGQGDALLVEAEGRRMLIDAGPGLFGSDAGRKTILPFLERTGSRKIDALLITHGHDDHCGGLRSLLEAAEVCSLYAPRGLVSRLARESGRRFQPLGCGAVLSLGGVRCYVLAPEASGEEDTAGNGASVVVKLQAGSTSWLLMGDAPVESEERMVRRFGTFLRSDAVKVGHHGSSTSSSAEFVRCVNPRVAMISAGRNNRFAHPAEDVVSRYRNAGSVVRRTDVEGAVITESDGIALQVVEWKR